MKNIIKEEFLDVFLIFLVSISLYLYNNNFPRISFALIIIPTLVMMFGLFYNIKYMMHKKTIYIFTVVKYIVEKRTQKLFFIVRNIIIYSIHFYLIYKFSESISSIYYGKQMFIFSIVYISMYSLSILATVFYDLLIIVGFYQKNKIDKLYAEQNPERK